MKPKKIWYILLWCIV